MATRVVATGLPIEQIRNVFVQKVAGSTWKIVDDWRAAGLPIQYWRGAWR